jgi:indole-3-glycerol phosphate synthase
VNILDKILADKAVEVRARYAELPLDEVKTLAEKAGERPDFVASLRSVPVGVIAEVKRKSPSAGLIREPFDPAAIARRYEECGARAISCLMDHKYFGGGAEDFATVRAAVELPMLYKEFVIDPWQIYHAKATGASAVLLIVAALEKERLLEFMELIRELKMTPLVEVHTREEMEIAVACGCECIGINNRNLKTFVTSIDTTLDLMGMAPEGVTLISESGIKCAEDVQRLRAANINGILVGEGLLRQTDPGAALQHLVG